MQDILKRLKEFAPKQKRGYVSITIPVVIYLDGGLLELRIKRCEENYQIYVPRDFFVDANARLDDYYKIFEKYDQNHHFDVKIEKGKLCKTYSNETNIVVAINEFVRFCILFDNFFMENSVVGSEKNFPI